MKFLCLLPKVACCVVLCAGFLSADSLELRNGRHLQGKYIGGTTTSIGFMTSGAVEYFSTGDVLAIIFDNNPDTSMNGVQPNAKVPNDATQSGLHPMSSRKAKRSQASPQLRRTSTATNQIID